MPEEYLGPEATGILVVDRYKAYQAMAQVKQVLIVLAFCWAHVHRDFVAVARSWPEQLALDEQAYRAQIAYLFDRSGFYRQKLRAAGLSSARAVGGLSDIHELPLTDKAELKATYTAENPIGAHLCVARDEIVRIYSTSGTTGTPSYIPLTAADLENWVTGSAQSYGASGIGAGQRVVTTYNAGPFVAGAALGIRKAIARSLADDGARVIACDLLIDELSAIARGMDGGGRPRLVDHGTDDSRHRRPSGVRLNRNE